MEPPDGAWKPTVRPCGPCRVTIPRTIIETIRRARTAEIKRERNVGMVVQDGGYGARLFHFAPMNVHRSAIVVMREEREGRCHTRLEGINRKGCGYGVSRT